ncbi:MAG: class I SAM-dependent methyltransferase [Asgard group archaeon]|nr:class I SAM-dependent methyltransferase [Asgard group archaeon]
MAHDKPKNNELFYIDTQKLVLEEIETIGYILDIGGGGEGVIGQLMHEQVIAIDKNKRELEEAPSENLKIVMDATDLKFLDESFHTVTAFFSFMYMDDVIKEKVFKEIFRVLNSNGKLLIWGVNIPEKSSKEKAKIFVVPLEITIPHKVIKTGYGSPFRKQDKNSIIKMTEKAGFKKLKEEINDQTFYLELIKE